MAIKLGKPVRGLGPKDIAAHSIWIEYLDEEEYDEDFVAPVLTNTNNVTREMVTRHYSVLIVFRVEGTDMLGVGSFSDLPEFTPEWVMDGKKQVLLSNVKGLKAPVILVPLPKLLGKAGLRYKVRDLDERNAKLV